MENEKEKSYHTLQKYKIGQSTIKICVKKIPTEEEIKQYLLNIYDGINDLARKLKKEGVDTSDWFYTDEQIQEMKKDPNVKFI